MTIFTIGHSTRSFQALVRLLRAWDIELVADVRTAPRSRRNPQFNAVALARALAAAAISYERLPGLGGWRRPRSDSPNTGWRVASFRGYADYMRTDEFAHALEILIERARMRVTCVMCAEAVPWRCHRSLIADALAVRGWDVQHILSEHDARPHAITSFAHVTGTSITYPAGPGV